MKCLIQTQPLDHHAIFVKQALEAIGHDVYLLFMADLPTQQRTTVSLTSSATEWNSQDQETHIASQPFDVVWWRRARLPMIPKDKVHQDDYGFVRKENVYFYDGFLSNLAPEAWWVNRKDNAERANLKLLQLKVARECGLCIPKTICSNNPSEIRQFIQGNPAGTIYKVFTNHCWRSAHATKATYTNLVSLVDLPDDDVIQLTPGIYQEKINKQFEIRITCFGHHMVAAKINSQSDKAGMLDWRLIPEERLSIEPFDLPPQIQRYLRVFMRQMGLVFGTFDFIVTPEGDYVFLEINEQGQFLWIESCNEDFFMLDTFIQFLCHRSPRFSYDPSRRKHRLSDYEASVERLIKQHEKQHVVLDRIVF